jgi:uncharacterized protein (DUF1684 family)
VSKEGYLTELGFIGPSTYQLADWRLQIQSLYAVLRAFDNAEDAWELWKARRNELFATHPSSPLSSSQKEKFRGVKVFDYDPAMRFEVGIHQKSGPVQYQNIGPDGSAHFQQLGETDGLRPSLGQELAIYWMLGYGGGLFIPFRDASNGKETSKCGRFLVDAIKGADLGMSRDGKLILDFNFCYHPSCVWNERYVSPTAPDGDKFDISILAGERV